MDDIMFSHNGAYVAFAVRSLTSLLWKPCVVGADIMFLPSGFFYLLSFFLSSDAGMKRAAAGRCKYKTQKIAKNSPSGRHRTTLSGYVFAIKARIDNRKKNFLSSNISSRCFHNMVNFGPLAAEMVPVVWGTPANFNGFRVLAALLHPVVGVSQTLRR